MTLWQRFRYKYIDDTGNAWAIVTSDYLAEAGGLETIPRENPENIRANGRNYKPRHIKLMALVAEPGQQEYRTDVITNERDPSKLLNTIIQVRGIEMKCIRYVGEQRTGR